jgi:hypothetical protein
MFNDWNSFDNISGVKSYTMNGFDDLKVQIHQDIYNTFPGDADQGARLLAQDMHTSSQVFAADFFLADGHTLSRTMFNLSGYRRGSVGASICMC